MKNKTKLTPCFQLNKRICVSKESNYSLRTLTNDINSFIKRKILLRH